MARKSITLFLCAVALGLTGCAAQDAPGPQADQTPPQASRPDANATALTVTLNAPDSFGEAYAAAFRNELAVAGYLVVQEGGQCRIDQTITVARTDALEKRKFSPSFGLESLAIKAIIRAGEYVYRMEELSETVDSGVRIQCGPEGKGFARRYTYDKISQEEINAGIAKDQAELVASALAGMRRTR